MVEPYALPFSQPYHLGTDAALPSYAVCVGLQDNGSWCGPSTSDNGVGVLNRDWYTVGPGDGMWASFDPLDPNLVWTTSTNSDTGQVYLYDNRTKQTRDISPDAELTQDAPSRLRYRFNWNTPIAFTPDGQALVGGNVVFRSGDHGLHWTVISPDLTRNERSHQGVSGGPISQDMSGAETADTIFQIVPAKRAAGQIWVGTDDGLVQLTRDGGATWMNVTPAAMPAWANVSTIEPGHAAAGTAYVAVDGHALGDERPHLFVTDDFGATWRSIASDLPPHLFVRTVREDPKNTDILYAGTQRGVWVSFDRGLHWHALRLNMPASAVYDLPIQPETNDLLVATHGRGVWILDDLRPLQEWTATRGASITLYQPRDAYRMWLTSPINEFLNGALPAGDFVGENRPYGAPITYDLARAAKKVTIEIVDPQGHVVKHIAGKAVSRHVGMNRATWDLTEDGPARWSGTFEQNCGPKSGAEALPAAYTARLIVDGISKQQPVVVRADPRDPSTTDELAARHAILTELNGELDQVDRMLNAIDRRVKRATPVQIAPLNTFKHRLTLDPSNIEDLRTPPRIRERLLDLLGRVGSSSFQAPTSAQSAEAAQLRAQTAALTGDYAEVK